MEPTTARPCHRLALPRRPAVQVVLAMTVYAAVFSTLCILRWYTGAKGDPDYGVFDQSFWTLIHDHLLFYNTYEGGSHFRIHCSPVFFLLAPCYAALPGVPTLLVLQTLAVAAGAWAVFLLGRLHVDDRTGALAAFTYLLYHPLHGVNYDQFNELSFCVAPLLFAFYCMYQGRLGAMWAWLALAMACKEDVAFVAFMVGIYAMGLAVRQAATKENRLPFRAAARTPLFRHGALICAAAAAWLWLCLQVILPHFRAGQPWPYFRLYYGHLGATMEEAVRTILTRPDVVAPWLFNARTLQLVLELLAPLALLPLLCPGVLMVGVPTWMVLNLSSFKGTQNTGSRYMAPLVAILFVALVLALRKRAGSDAGRAARLARWPVALSLLFMLAIDNTPVRFPFKNIPVVTRHDRLRSRLLDRIPPDASVCVQADFFGRVAHRRRAWTEFVSGTDYVLVDPTGDPRSGPALWFWRGHFDRALPPLIASGQYVLVAQEDGAKLYRRVW